MILLLSPTIEEMAARIERAYLRRRPEWRGVGMLGRLWTVTAAHLSALHRKDPTLPLDPELYVAALPLDTPQSDPWEELICGASARHYRRRVRQIVRGLRRELVGEVRRAEARLGRGEPAEAVLLARSQTLSPLGRYVAAHRANRPDLADRLRAAAQDQHRACPLYRPACLPLLRRGDYPVQDLVPGLTVRRRDPNTAPPFSLN